MTVFRLSRGVVVALYLLVVALLAAGVWYSGYRQALGQVAARGEADLALAADRLVTQLIRYRETAVLMADHPVLQALHYGGGRREADALLLEAVDKTAALTAFYADTQGRVLASAHGEAPATLTEAAYFQRALQGALGSTRGSSAGFDQRAYSYAAPAFGPESRVQGVLVVVVDIDNLEQDWRGARPTVYFADDEGEVFITNRSEMLGWRRDARGLGPATGARPEIAVERLAGHEIWYQALSPYIPGAALHLSRPLPVVGLIGEALVDVSPARRLAGLQAAAVAALCLTFGALLFLATERRRALAEANAVLEERVAARTADLEDVNTALRREVAERQEAEAALKRAQAELVQAGKLSALGQMSAGISHELNQPLMAIRSFAENGTAFLARGESGRTNEALSRIGDMAGRMARIIKNLRAFARQESAPVGRVDLRAVLDSAVEITEARLQASAVVLDWQRPAAPVWVKGGEVRLGQVFVNLITNAADAMDEMPGPRELTIGVRQGAATEVLVRDTGPGIEEPERIFDPFYTTKAVGSGDGMGLGLSISYGLVQSFGGSIRGANVAGGGSEFTVVLEPWSEEQAA
ncbi:MAG: ATP-binding protein [Paracoccaceae bacterium]|nr:ATP-binding protein [Paracoccaceae bacterium]